MLPEKVTKLVGRAGDTMIMEVDRGGIKRFADAIGDFNPLYWDEEYAKSSRYGSIISPPGYFGWPTRCVLGLPRWPSSRKGRARFALTRARGACCFACPTAISATWRWCIRPSSAARSSLLHRGRVDFSPYGTGSSPARSKRA